MGQNTYILLSIHEVVLIEYDIMTNQPKVLSNSAMATIVARSIAGEQLSPGAEYDGEFVEFMDSNIEDQ